MPSLFLALARRSVVRNAAGSAVKGTLVVGARCAAGIGVVTLTWYSPWVVPRVELGSAVRPDKSCSHLVY